MSGVSRVAARPAPSDVSSDRIGPRMTAYSMLLVAACCVVIAAGWPAATLSDALFWIPVIAVANLARISTLPRLRVDTTLGSVAIVASALLHEPSAVVLFALIGCLHVFELRLQAPIVMALFNRAMFALCGGVAALGAGAVYAAIGSDSWRIVPAGFVAIAMFDLTNHLLLAVMLVIRRGRTWSEALRHAANPIPKQALNAAASALLSLLIAVLVRDVSRWAVVLVVVPVWLGYSAQQSARRAQDRAEELVHRVKQLETINALSRKLLSARSREEIPDIVTPALAEALETPHVVVELGATDDGGVDPATDGADPPSPDASHPDVARVPVVAAEPAAIVVPGGVDERARAVIEASAALVGLTLTRLQLEADLAANERARTALTGRILEEAAVERSRIAVGVHDEVLPLLAAAQMKIDMLDVMLERDPGRAQAAIDGALHAVTDGIDRLRDTLEALRQSTLVPGGLRDGMASLLADLQSRTGIRTRLEAPEDLTDLPFAVELLVFETLRGLLANVEKHSGATTVRVSLEVNDDSLVLRTQDDGRGFDAGAVGQRSHGLALMRQRAELARGRFEVSARPGEGTTVQLEVPTW